MNQMYKPSLIAAFLLIFLLPIFFLPTTLLSMGITKVVLLSTFVIAILLSLIMEAVRRGGIVVPWHPIFSAVFILPLTYFISALVNATPNLSLFGYGFEIDTFGSVLIASSLMGLFVLAFQNDARQDPNLGNTNILIALAAFTLSITLLALFAVVKIFSGGSFPVWGAFFGQLGNPVGGWADYAFIFGLFSVLSALALGISSIKGPLRIFLYVAFSLSTIIFAIINFSFAFPFTLAASAIVIIYLITIETGGSKGSETRRKVMLWPAIALCTISLLFVINPTVSGTYGELSETVSATFGIVNSDVRPSFSATFNVARQVLETGLFLGAGPNSFGSSWLLYKPKELNNTIFWDTSFPYGIGFIPTQAASVGVVGMLVWLSFIALFFIVGIKAMAKLPENVWQRFGVVTTFLGALFLWLINVVYTPSIVMFGLAFIFTGLFLAALGTSGIISSKRVTFRHSAAINFGSALTIVALCVGSVALGFVVLQRAMSFLHYQKALVLSGTAGASVVDIENELAKAIRLVPQDTYYRALSQIQFSKAQSVFTRTTGTEEENQEAFRNALTASIAAAQAAIDKNSKNYGNWVNLAVIYSSLVPAPLSVEGAYENAHASLKEAKKHNPYSPQIPLLQARLELSRDNNSAARIYLEESLSFKQDYADAYFLLTQLEIKENNLTGALRAAETNVLLSPDNAGVFFQLGLLRYQVSDFLGAAQALNQALVVLPNYANAKYFLGLSLEELGRHQEAIEHFEELALSNPDNAEVVSILENLKAGKDPLSQIPSSVSNVSSRTSPPISELEQ